VPGTTYTYTVEAFDTAGNHSPLSSPATATANGVDTTPPHATTYLTATAVLVNRIDLEWAAATDNVGVTRYTIQRDGAVLGTVDGNTTTYSDPTVAPATTYTYSIVASDAAGNSSNPSSPLSVTTPGTPDTTPPTAPAKLTTTAVIPNQIDLAWTAATDNMGVAKYTIQRNGTVLATVDGSTTTYSDSTVVPGTTYAYSVIAADATGNQSNPSNLLTVTTPSGTDTTPPTAPTNLTATVTDGQQVLLHWNAATDNVGVVSYMISRNGVELTVVGGDTQQYLDSSVVPGTRYLYAVQAIDAANNISDSSNSVTVSSSPTITSSKSIFLPLTVR
jgi:chitinase